MTQEEFLDQIRKEMRETVHNAVTLITNAAQRLQPVAGTPPPISIDDLRRSEEKASNTARVLAHRDDQLLNYMQGMESRMGDRMKGIEDRLPTSDTNATATAAATAAAVVGQQSVAVQQDTIVELAKYRRAIILSLVLPVAAVVTSTVVDRIYPRPVTVPSGQVVPMQAVPTVIYQSLPPAASRGP